MKLSKKEVQNIANLARLGLSKKEEEHFAEQISAILDYVEQLSELDTEKTEPIAQITGLENVMFDDEIGNKQDQKNMLKNAPDKENGFIKVKSVLE